ncbi:MAG: pantoate--beta-alanine ligase [Lentisphaerae bacterium]|jgi:pantoate--beta-alanine ligase|nr:pantoate--beta-alanine ligase [Lentisphaerota bacterium]MBT4817662.1 pantoate--beta-alanine ligase [Lentisphaerota bacterium]MBT5607580.1 pantoate--beta-alanine ligase [Lentisphaerota bacterium]MBT7054559.1 pantoate--beta-alanine ligase [Lentisphaerota bacterium]MBT7845201.1 pantoate--beta-alanine ligase [Lentisphaerota bacterium]
MIIVRTVAEMQGLSRRWRREGKRVGFVPTMGFLHDGHLSLVRLARDESDVSAVSIFVNPTQFGPSEDLAQYPRDFLRDEALCRGEGVDCVFYPAPEEMYASDFSTWVEEGVLSKPLCGQARPTHFRGVTTVVTKLFNAVLPDVAVFGRKDAQQALVIERMVRDLNVPVRIIVGDIIRESDGLAMSSRNKYLSVDERQRALSIRAGLLAASRLYDGGEKTAEVLRLAVLGSIEEQGGKVDYVELVSRAQLAALPQVSEPAVIAVAAFFGKTRLIDNCYLG